MAAFGGWSGRLGAHTEIDPSGGVESYPCLLCCGIDIISVLFLCLPWYPPRPRLASPLFVIAYFASGAEFIHDWFRDGAGVYCLRGATKIAHFPGASRFSRKLMAAPTSFSSKINVATWPNVTSRYSTSTPFLRSWSTSDRDCSTSTTQSCVP